MQTDCLMATDAINLLSLAPAVAALLLPGFLWQQSEGKFVSRGSIGRVEEVYTYVLYSLLAYTVPLILFSADYAGVSELGDISLELSAKTLVAGGISGTLGGIGTGLLRRFDGVGWVCGRLGLSTVHPFQTAWDRAFMRSKGCLVRVTFKDGTNRYGVYGSKSLVSTEASERDIYLEQAYCQAADGGLEQEIGTLGIWIPHSEVECVRFYSYENLNTDDARKRLNGDSND